MEGRTDELALTLAARRSGRNLQAEGVSIVVMNGVHAMGRYIARLFAEAPDAKLAGLYDESEEQVVRAALERAGYGASLERGQLERAGFFACSVDLEEELIRAAGEPLLSRLIELEGDRQPWQRLRSQRTWHDRPFDQQFRRFIRSVSGRNTRYIRAIIEAIEPAQLPRPLRLLLAAVSPPAGAA